MTNSKPPERQANETVADYIARVNAERASHAPAAASGEATQAVAWSSMDSAPKDGTLLRLLVDFEDHATEDSPEPCPTIGANSRDNTGVDEWTFAGWNWTHDCFTQGTGTPIGWMPMLSTEPEAWLQSIVDDGYRTDDERYMAKRLLELAPAPKAASGEAVTEQALIEASNAGYAQGLADGKTLAKANPAAGAEPVAWLNYPCKIDGNGNFAGYGKPELSFQRLSYGYDWTNAKPLVHPPATSERDAEKAELLFLFMGWLTSHPKRWVFSASDDATVGVQALQEFTAQHGISLDAQREQSEKRSGEGGK